MKFEVAGREVNLLLEHFLVVIVGWAAYIFLFILVSGVLALSAGALSLGSLTDMYFKVSSYILLASHPVMAILFLAAASMMRMKRDEGFCRSVAAASCALSVIVYVALFFMMGLLSLISGIFYQSINYDFSYFMNPLSMIASLLAIGSSSILTYLWLRIITKPDVSKLKKAAAFAFMFALSMFVIEKLAVFLLGYIEGFAYTISFADFGFKLFLSDLVFGFAILYHTMKKLDMKAAGLFAGLYLGSSALAAVGALVFSQIYDPKIILFCRDLLALALLYLFSRGRDTL